MTLYILSSKQYNNYRPNVSLHVFASTLCTRQRDITIGK